jgi:hypothetical protein
MKDRKPLTIVFQRHDGNYLCPKDKTVGTFTKAFKTIDELAMFLFKGNNFWMVNGSSLTRTQRKILYKKYQYLRDRNKGENALFEGVNA